MAAAKAPAAAPTSAKDRARAVLARLESGRGICVLLGKAPTELAVELARQSELTVYLQLPPDEPSSPVLSGLDDAGLLGVRVVVERGPWSGIHLADNLADAVVVTPESLEAAQACRDELFRVVRPLGLVLLGDEQLTKPYPAEADDWTHPYHGPDNNPQSGDRLARAPYLTQFLAEPWYVPFPEVTVTSEGRVFKAFGHVGYKERDWPWLNTLVAINGYNGTMLWRRPLEEGFNIHRNTMVATPETLYVGDGTSCKLIDAATGELRREIVAPDGAAGPVWKWMAIEDGVLYALVGAAEYHDETLRGTRTAAGWPWKPMTAGYDGMEYPWGFGRTFFAMDLANDRVLWMHLEEEPIDSRAVAMRGKRIYYYSPEKFLAALDVEHGKPAWRNADAKLLEAIGPTTHAQNAPLGFSTTSFLKCSDEAIYFAGPQRERLVAASTEDGRLLWQYPHGNFQLVIREEGLYALGRTGPSKLFDPLTGEVRAEIPCLRGNCTRATGTFDSIFTRGDKHGGTMRLAVTDNRPQRIALMRPDCHDGVIAAGGMLNWGPWMCDCSLSLVGMICLSPAGSFEFEAEAVEAERLKVTPAIDKPLESLPVRPGDWPTYRADNRRSAASRVTIPTKVAAAWQFDPPLPIDPAAPITAGDLIFASGSDGVVRAIELLTGKVRWKAYTAGPITYPPAVDKGRLLLGSGDGWVYAFEAASGKALWRFRVAPAERMINLYGRLASTWPVASGVLVQDGVVYAAAGIASYDGTHVIALDSRTGRIRWQNNTSGRLAGPQSVTGVSVQGHLLLDKDVLYLAGGNVVSPARYDAADGRCLNVLDDEWAKAPRGRELFLVGGEAVAFDQLLYSPREYWTGRYFARHFLQADSGEVLVFASGGRISRVQPDSIKKPQPELIWDVEPFSQVTAMALGNNAVVVAGRLQPVGDESGQAPDGERPSGYAVSALAVDDGRTLWTHPLPAAPDTWGLALNAAGQILVSLDGGRLIALAQSN
jgi:outer membrane protein assembly factor BamB